MRTEPGTLEAAAADPIGWADVIAVSSSAGKDSAAMLDLIVELATERGVLDRVVVIHADMGRMEWKSAELCGAEVPEGYDGRGSTELAEAQADAYGVPFYTCRRGNGDLLEQVAEKKVWPRVGMKVCQGTSDHKRGPIWTVLTKLAKAWHADNPTAGRRVRILDCQGLAAHESGKRGSRLRKLAKTTAGGRVDSCNATNATVREVVSFFPIADWASEAEVFERLQKAHELRGAPLPSWVYGIGMPRLSCSLCVFARREALTLAGRYNRDLLELYVETEAVTEPWRKEFTLAEVLADVDAGVEVSGELGWDDQA